MDYVPGLRVYTMFAGHRCYGHVIDTQEPHILVEFDQRPPWGGHDGGGAHNSKIGKPGHCWWYMESDKLLIIEMPTKNVEVKNLLKRR